MSAGQRVLAQQRSEAGITLTINGKKYTADTKISPETSLNVFLRNVANLCGTKAMCHEGGCGACIVAVTVRHPVTKKQLTYAVNSCLTPVLSCDGWAVTTIEGIGDRQQGYHDVQTRLAHFNGTQCGFCSPGMVMNMYSLLQSKESITAKEVDNSFGGNICRCTGYRPILDAFKSFCKDASPELKQKCQDIEDLHKLKLCTKSGKPCSGTCDQKPNPSIDCSVHTKRSQVHLLLQGAEWYTVSTIDEIFEIFNNVGDVPYMLIAGNTGNGVYRRTTTPKLFINVTAVPQLRGYSVDPQLTIGANMSLTEAMELFNSLAEQNKNYSYTKVLANHIDLIANVPVRNAGTIAGNLALKNQHHEFPSDVFLMLEAVGATVNIAKKGGITQNVSLVNFVNLDMKQCVIESIVLSPYDDNYFIKTYKIMPRAQNAHAYVNAGFLFKLDMKNSGQILEKPTVVFGGINAKFVHATKTEDFLEGKKLFDQSILEEACKILDSELDPDYVLPDATPEYRKGLAVSLFYKFILNVGADLVDKRLVSGGDLLSRPVSSGKQEYQTDESVWPLNKPVPKLEALTQCSGEAEYVNDIPTLPGELFAAFVVTTLGPAKLKTVDTSEALSMPGVVAFIAAENIPGKNSFTGTNMAGMNLPEEIFCSGAVQYAGQPVGVIVAVNQYLAIIAAAKVKLTYDEVAVPVISIRQALASGERTRIIQQAKIVATDTSGLDKVTHTVKGSFDMGSQYHFTMETQIAICVPTEDGMDIYPSSQWMDLTQLAVADALDIPEHNINVRVRRLGGGYGSKISRATHIAAACAVAAHALNKPVRLSLPLETNMAAIGKRPEVAVDYEVGVDDAGQIKYLNASFYENLGCSENESSTPAALVQMKNCYAYNTWTVAGYGVKTDISSTTYCRAPATLEGIATIEHIMDHIATEVEKDPTDVRLANMVTQNNPLPQFIADIKQSAEFDERSKAAHEFNQANRWKKKGIALVPMLYRMETFGYFSATVIIYAHDGSVAVCHGGIEMGQGINTKVAQVAAYMLGTPLDLVKVKPSNNFTAPNNMVTGGSMGSEACSYATMMACIELTKRLQPYKEQLDNPTWTELVWAAHAAEVELSASYMLTTKDNVKPYSIFGVTITEVIIDVLTGQHQITRVDILEDAGRSLSPEVDVGQVEGGFIFGLGYWLSELLVYDPKTGRLLTDRTWNYKPPGAKDIPIDFRIQLRRNSTNPIGVLRSKATGEPPLCMSCSVLFALRQALSSAREEIGLGGQWYKMDAPATTENIFLTSLTKFGQFSY